MAAWRSEIDTASSTTTPATDTAAFSRRRRSSKKSSIAPATSGITIGATIEVLRIRVHRSGSFPSTWSVPVRPREASRTTRKSAVVAKLMTIAVSTSACGTGSA